MKLLLWDIDGTLICSGRAGERALVRAMKKIHGIDTDLAWVDFRGRTDALIARNLYAHHKLDPHPQSLHDFLEAYLAFLPEEMRTPSGKTLPGILDILEKVRLRPDLRQGLLTGNLSRGAQIKLEHYQVWHYFEFGAFADDSPIRNELGPHALRRAREKFNREFPPENVFIIGDTPHDIACGKIIGAKTIAVATGGFSLEDLRAHHPTALLADFQDVDAFFGVIDGN